MRIRLLIGALTGLLACSMPALAQDYPIDVTIVVPRVEVRKLLDSRVRYGVKSGAGMEHEMPLTAEDLRRGEKIQLTREDLVSILDEALRSRGVLA